MWKKPQADQDCAAGSRATAACARGDVDFAVVNGNYAVSSGMKFTEALALEKATPT